MSMSPKQYFPFSFWEKIIVYVFISPMYFGLFNEIYLFINVKGYSKYSQS
jgi:hypothetical protein